ncbi:hypothetical protein CS534_10940 [Yersinia ruckeri]|nr:hypothetical protein CS534_10940 [Yersinia ruckeri]
MTPDPYTRQLSNCQCVGCMLKTFWYMISFCKLISPKRLRLITNLATFNSNNPIDTIFSKKTSKLGVFLKFNYRS